MLRLLVCALALAACAAPAHDAGLDPALRRHLATVGPEALVEVLVGLREEAPPTAAAALTEVGLEVRTVAGDVAIARGTAAAIRRAAIRRAAIRRAAIRRAAALPDVVRIARSQDRPPLTAPAL